MEFIAVSGAIIFAAKLVCNRNPEVYLLAVLPHTYLLVTHMGTEILTSLILTGT